MQSDPQPALRDFQSCIVPAWPGLACLNTGRYHVLIDQWPIILNPNRVSTEFRLPRQASSDEIESLSRPGIRSMSIFSVEMSLRKGLSAREGRCSCDSARGSTSINVCTEHFYLISPQGCRLDDATCVAAIETSLARTRGQEYLGG